MPENTEGPRQRKPQQPQNTKKYASFSEYIADVRVWLDSHYEWSAFCQFMAMQDAAMHSQLSPINQQMVNTVTQAQAPNANRPAAQVQPAEVTFHAPAIDFRPAPMLRRIAAELIDSMLCVFVKFFVIYMLIESDLIDLGDYEKVVTEDHDLVDFILLTQALLPLEVICKVICSALEGLVMSVSFGNKEIGQTPGKYVMNIRVLSAVHVHELTMTGEHVRVNGPRNLTLKSCMIRSFLKNMVVNGLFPLSTLAFSFPYNRSFYDVVLNSVVICV